MEVGITGIIAITVILIALMVLSHLDRRRTLDVEATAIKAGLAQKVVTTLASQDGLLHTREYTTSVIWVPVASYQENQNVPVREKAEGKGKGKETGREGPAAIG